MLGHDFTAAIGQESVDHYTVEATDFLDDLHALAKECVESFGAANAGDRVRKVGEYLVLPLKRVRAAVQGQPFDHRHRAASVAKAFPLRSEALCLRRAGLFEAGPPGQDDGMRGRQRFEIETIRPLRDRGPVGQWPGKQRSSIVQSRPMTHDACGGLHDAAAGHVHGHQETIGLHSAQQVYWLLGTGFFQLHWNGVVMRTHALHPLPAYRERFSASKIRN